VTLRLHVLTASCSCGFAASRAESLWLSDRWFLKGRGFASGGVAAKSNSALDGKPEAFRTEGGKAA